ncbi:adenosylcobinamide-phosphate synthase CbiB [Pelagibius sp. CAU 1746]|uniref:adenosylcobinamide-phosphate synthase CbiB n=1 Tax=Pelagibius sp. CAU 1746 TaxID=3140370 RepID=UPI00325A8275
MLWYPLFGGQWQSPASALAVLLLAMAMDLLLGDPRWLYRLLPHPVVLLGRLIAVLDRALNRQSLPRGRRLLLGGLCTGLVVGIAGGLGALLHHVLAGLPYGWIVEGLLASSLLAFRGLYDAVRRVARGLAESLEAGRDAVAHIVGRDPASLDAAGVGRAAAESAAENFSDGFVAPVFWFLLLGMPGLLAYKAVNTLDSMIGHRNARYEAFGKAAARLDDAVNFLPARLAGLLIVLAAVLLPAASASGAWRALRRDAPRHRSPNAGWQEAALAGALGLALAGPRQYGGQMVEDRWMGDGRREVTAEDLSRVLDLYLAAGGLLFAAVMAMLLIA